MRFRKEDRSIIDAAVMSYHISDVVPVTLSRGRHLRPSGLTVSLPLVLTGATGAALLTSLHFKAILQPQIYFDKKKRNKKAGITSFRTSFTNVVQDWLSGRPIFPEFRF